MKSKLTAVCLFRIFVLFILLGNAKLANSQSLKFFETHHKSAGWGFQKNLGQLHDENGKPLPQIRYYGESGNLSLYCSDTKIGFVMHYAKKIEPGLLNKVAISQLPDVHYARMEMEFIGANTMVQIFEEAVSRERKTSYLPYTTSGIVSIENYHRLVYYNLYNGIDLILESKDEGLKYSFRIHPGAKPENIKLKWNGTHPEMLRNAEIKYSNELGEITESKPYTFTESGRALSSNALVQGNVVRFNISDMPSNETVILDPSLKWSTFFGGSGYDQIMKVVTDKMGNIYAAGSTQSLAGIATSGAFQTTLGGSSDWYIMKFDNNGKRIWCTYMGGSAYDFVYDLELTKDGRLLVAGNALSKGLATPGRLHDTLYGNTDILLAKFDTSGTRLWSTYFGGTASDGQSGCNIQQGAKGEIFLAGSTQSTDYIATANARQTQSGSAGIPYSGDAFLAKLDSSGKSVNWSTYFGGSGDDYASALTMDSLGYLYLAGNTSSGKQIATLNGFQQKIGGNTDGFVARFDTSGAVKWATYFGGPDFDYLRSINIGPGLKIYLGGQANSGKGIATKGSYQTSLNAFGDAFLANYDTSGTLNWATYYGGNSSESINDIKTDTNGVIYTFGYTYSTNGISTKGAYLTGNPGFTASFMGEFNQKGTSLLYGTYLFPSQVQSASSISQNQVILGGYSESVSQAATKGAFQTKYGGGYYDGFLLKLSLLNCHRPTIKPSNFICQWDTVPYFANVGTGTTLTWRAFGGAIISGQGNDSVRVRWDSAVVGKIYIIEKAPNGCADSTFQVVTILDGPAVLTGGNKSICLGKSLVLGDSAVTGSAYAWFSNPAGFTSTLNNPVVNPKKTTTYYLKETNGYSCSRTDSAVISVFPQPNSTITGKLWVCPYSNEIYTARKYSPGIYTWNVTSGTIISGANTDSTHVIWDSTGIGSIDLKIKAGAGCVDSNSQMTLIDVYPNAKWKAKPLAANEFSFTANDASQTTYLWDFGDGAKSNKPSETHKYTKAGTYKVSLIVRLDSCLATSDSTISLLTGIQDVSLNSKIEVYPNPFKDVFNLNFELARSANLKIEIIDLTGRVVETILNQFMPAGFYRQSVRHSGIGIYFLRISEDGKVGVKPLIKQ